MAPDQRAEEKLTFDVQGGGKEEKKRSSAS